LQPQNSHWKPNDGSIGMFTGSNYNSSAGNRPFEVVAPYVLPAAN